MEETTDEGADRRRLQKILAILARSPGEQPVELALRLRNGQTQIVRLEAGVADAEALVPEIQPLLGVLGQAQRLGSHARELAAAAV
jgi:hypothetical protein